MSTSARSPDVRSRRDVDDDDDPGLDAARLANNAREKAFFLARLAAIG